MFHHNFVSGAHYLSLGKDSLKPLPRLQRISTIFSLNAKLGDIFDILQVFWYVYEVS